MKVSFFPNIITVLRFILVIPIVVLLVERHYTHAFYLFIIAGLSDGLDGFLARKFNWTSRFGSIADPLADKLLMLGCFSALAWLGYVPVWVWALVFVRDLVISFGALYYQHCIEPLVFNPSRISKLNTLAQIVLIGLLLWHLGVMQIPVIWIGVILWVMVVTTVASFINYVWVWSARAWHKTRDKSV